MEYWLFSQGKEMDTLLDCQLYSAVYGYSRNLRQIIDIKSNHTIEIIEAIACLDIKKKWLINPINENGEINFDVIKHVRMNRKDLPHIKLSPKIKLSDSGTRLAAAVISYGCDYLILDSSFSNIETIHWLAKFRDKKMYGTRIMVFDDIHYQIMKKCESISYDGVIFRDSHILQA
jgi:hypothetical protein